MIKSNNYLLKSLLAVLFIFIFIFIIITTSKSYYNIESFTDTNKEKKYKIEPSKIHGNGLQCISTIYPNEIIDCAITRNISSKQYIISPDFGLYINHKLHSNTNLELISDSGYEYYLIVANRTINPGEEITSNYDGVDIPSFIDGSKSYYNE